MQKYTIVIQGPLEKHAIDGIKNYQKYGKVLVSTWDYVDISTIPEEVKCVVKKQPNKSNSLGTKTNIYYAISGMQNALNEVDTEYVIRTRGDEVYKNLSPFIEKFEKDDKKFVCGNIFARKWEDVPFHIGDHLYIAKTKILKKGIDKLKRMWDGEDSLEKWGQEGGGYIEGCGGFSDNGEGILSRSFLYANDIKEEMWTNKNLFLDYFEICDINLAEEFIAMYQTSSSGPVKYINNFTNPHNVKNTEDF